MNKTHFMRGYRAAFKHAREVVAMAEMLGKTPEQLRAYKIDDFLKLVRDNASKLPKEMRTDIRQTAFGILDAMHRRLTGDIYQVMRKLNGLQAAQLLVKLKGSPSVVEELVRLYAPGGVILPQPPQADTVQDALKLAQLTGWVTKTGEWDYRLICKEVVKRSDLNNKMDHFANILVPWGYKLVNWQPFTTMQGNTAVDLLLKPNKGS